MRTDTFLADRYRRIVKRRGKLKGPRGRTFVRREEGMAVFASAPALDESGSAPTSIPT